ncbi:uncharacterized protein BKA78DRAFT_153570 [Phyllosticta capitalensis]|uniref:uncharacterized protein n=1 Tax=Phyllosticta capitalensis TaxID=121624 RepID=UPI00312FD95A
MTLERSSSSAGQGRGQGEAREEEKGIRGNDAGECETVDGRGSQEREWKRRRRWGRVGVGGELGMVLVLCGWRRESRLLACALKLALWLLACLLLGSGAAKLEIAVAPRRQTSVHQQTGRARPKATANFSHFQILLFRLLATDPAPSQHGSLCSLCLLGQRSLPMHGQPWRHLLWGIIASPGVELLACHYYHQVAYTRHVKIEKSAATAESKSLANGSHDSENNTALAILVPRL